MKTTIQQSPIEQIRQEFQERWGVDIQIDISVHGNRESNKHVTEELAQEIVTTFHEDVCFRKDEVIKSKWVRPTIDSPEPFKVVVFYDGKDKS